jgi:homocysteine S-methyltransferase
MPAASLLSWSYWTTRPIVWSIPRVIDPLTPFVLYRGAAVLDGGLATELEARGLDLRDRLWSARALLEAPDLISAIHRDYLDAGADIVTTATYQATIPGLVARGLSEADARRVLLSAVALARRARDAHQERAASDGRPRPIVAASMGSYGAYLADGSEYRGEFGLSVEALANWHRPRLRVLEESGAEILAFETIPSLSEAEAIARLLAEREGPPAWISFQARDARRLADGASLADAANIAERCARIVAVGVNCVAPERVVPLLRAVAQGTAKRLAAYPNRGDAWDPVGRRWVGQGRTVDFGALAASWRETGAGMIGGCCRTTPGDVRAIVAGLGV